MPEKPKEWCDGCQDWVAGPLDKHIASKHSIDDAEPINDPDVWLGTIDS